MEGDVFEVPLSVERMRSEKAYRESKLTIIVAIVCALLNSAGGQLNIEFEDVTILGDATDGILKTIEQRLIDMTGSCVFYAKVRMQKRNVVSNQIVFMVDSSQLLCTVDYNLYLPTDRQVIPISPFEPPESVKAILNKKVRNQEQFENYQDFLLNTQVPFQESDSIQFKQLKSEKSKCISLADRMTNKSNKLERYISAFANHNGGSIFFGIKDDGVVKGEVIGEQIEEEIIRKVTTGINKMIWSGGQLKRDKHWNIQFAPVRSENLNEIPSLFVVIISVVPLRGGLFVQQPESYRVVHGQYERMSFTEWRRSADMDTVPNVVCRTVWSSTRTHKDCHQVLQLLLKYQNNGDHYAFEKFATLAQSRYQVAEVQLIILGERSAHAYKTGKFEKADSLMVEYEHSLSQQHTEDYNVFLHREAYAKSAIPRAKGGYEESYALAQSGLQLADMTPAGILTAWFHNHLGILEKHLSQQVEGTESTALEQSSLDHFTKALQHTQASKAEQKFSTTIADSYHRIYLSRANSYLGDFVGGPNLKQVTPSNIKAAETDMINYNRLVVEGHPPTKYREIYHLITKSDLRLCQWWQQRKQQRQQTQDESFLEDDEIRNLVDEAFHLATTAKERAISLHFQELTDYACTRIAKITEIMIKVKVSSLRLPR